MTFENRITIRVAFAARRRELLNDWLRAHEIRSDGVAHWALRLRETNDAEQAFDKLVEVL
jgi:hypothetical protein